MEIYDHEFYEARHRATLHAANTILSAVLEILPTVRSAIDLGCGVGTWLTVLKERGVSEIFGVDGTWLERELLVIPANSFRQVDLTERFVMDRRFDLAISLEVAEHLPPASARPFVESLVSLSDFVLFSAAIPAQGGVGHLNEQWPDYWAELFSENGYVAVDAIRRKVWNDVHIPFWYRQNILLFVRRDRVQDLQRDHASAGSGVTALSVVHPALYDRKVGQMTSIKGSWRLFSKSITNSIRRMWRSRRLKGA